MPRMDTFDEVMASVAAPIDFTLTMDADSTNEVYVDIDTGLDDGEALLIYGMEYGFESIDPTVPLDFLTTADFVSTLQVHRNDDATLLLNMHDSEVLLHDYRLLALNTSGAYQANQPFKCSHRTVTMAETMRVIFRTAADCVQISLTSVQLSGRIFADKFEAPSMGVTKLGHLANL